MSKNENMLLKYESIANEGGEETRVEKEWINSAQLEADPKACKVRDFPSFVFGIFGRFSFFGA